MKKDRLYSVMITGMLTAFVMVMILFFAQCSPFGGKALTYMDADIQYLDFYLYYKDVLCGENSLIYTFGKALGGGGIALFSYYLSSPFCLLLPFFDATNLHVFFDLTVVLKLTLASMTCCYFLLSRFEDRIQEKVQYVFAVLLSLGYALGHYSMTQCSNIMWLDGVYMLPIILLCVYKVVQKQKGSCWKLALAVGYAIIANWYSAGIDCVFSIFWFAFELLLSSEVIENRKIKWKNCGQIIIRYGMSMFVGVLLSAALFLPTLGELSKSSKGQPEFLNVFKTYFHGNMLNTLRHYTYGALSDYGSVALFCGSIAVIAALSVFLSKDIKWKNKIVLAAMAFFALLICYWNPLFVLFSLLKNAESYWYRYSYLSIIIFVFLAAFYLFSCKNETGRYIPFISSVIFSGIYMMLNYTANEMSKNVYLTGAAFILTGLFLSVTINKKTRFFIRVLACVLLGCITIAELQYNAVLLINVYNSGNVEHFKEYERQESQQINAIKEYDDGQYRIAQTSMRVIDEYQMTAYYNEGLGYNYWPLSSYTSSPNSIQNQFMERLGYRKCSEAMCIVNTSILGADSLLGAKYILSGYPINGLKKIDEIPQYNGKDTYENPYCLPMAFTYEKNSIETDISNPFEFQNSLYSQLVGEKVQIYFPLEYEVVQEGDVSSGQSLVYKVCIPEGDYAVYGNIPCNSEISAIVSIDEKSKLIYSRWLSQSVFFIPLDDGQNESIITVNSDISYDIDQENVQFYALDITKLAEVTERLQKNTVASCAIENGKINVEIENANNDQQLFLSVSYDKNWTVKRNGEEIPADMIGECLYSIPLVDGQNTIEMEYHVPYLNVGIILTLIGIISVLAMIYFSRKSRKMDK